MTDIRIDTSNLTFTHFCIPEHSSRYIDGIDAPTIALEPGSYGFKQVLDQSAIFHFKVTRDGHIDYDLSNDQFLDGRGTHTLGVRGFSITFDATALSHGLFPLVAGPRVLTWKHRHPLILAPAAGYGFQSATNTDADFRFGIDVDGQITIDRRYARFARATARTPTTDPTLTIDGYKITVDARSLSHGLFPKELMDTPGMLARGRPHELTYIPAAGYGFQSATNTDADFRFGIDVDGQITIDRRYARFARATARTPTTDPTLTIDGYKITVDARTLPHDLVPASMFDSEIVLSREHLNELTLIPARYDFMAPTEPATELTFGLDADGTIDVLHAPPGATIASRPAMLLLIRPDDLVVLGIDWSGFQLEGSRLTAVSEPALVTVLFPPQHMAEEVTGNDLARARLSGTSQVVYRVAVGTVIDLTVDGFLEVLGRAKVQEQSAIELPWGLLLSPAAAATSDHPAQALQSDPAADVGLWRTRLSAGQVRPADARPDISLGFRTPVNSPERMQIVAESQRKLPEAQRLELTALGGALTARGDWDTFQWEQNVAVGRDQRVRFETEGVLYPLGHRAVFTVLTERGIGDGPAALRQRMTLAVIEPVRSSTGDNPVHRKFPFDTFELATLWYDNLPEPNWHPYPRPVPMLAEVRDELAGLRSRSDGLAAQADTEGHRVRRPEELGISEVSELSAAQLELAPKKQLREDDEANQVAANTIVNKMNAIQARITQLQLTDPESPQITDLQAQSSELSDELHTIPLLPHPVYFQLVQDTNRLQADVNRLSAKVDNECRRFRDVNELAVDGFGPAIDFVALQPQIVDAQAHVTDLEKLAVPTPHLFFTLPDQYLVRGRGRAGDVAFELPLIFVEDFTLEPTPDLPGVHSLTDACVAKLLRETYQQAIVPLPGVRIDLVRAPDPKPADVHDVYELTIVGTAFDGGFHPQIDRLTAALPALRTLLGDPDKLVPLKFSNSFLNLGAAESLPLLFEDGSSYPADFTGRAGALVTPSFSADAISRLCGPVAKAGLLKNEAGKLSAAQVFGNTARILGFPLKDLAPNLDAPPEITLVPPNSAKMTWYNVVLENLPPFKAGPMTRLNLTVERSPDHLTTSCVINDFTLQLGLLEVGIGSMTYTQKDDRPPRLEVDGVTLNVSGSLNLLKELFAKVQLGPVAPDIAVTPQQISVGYSLPIPEVTTVGFSLRNILFRLGVTIPLDGAPLTVQLAFASRANPFALNVLLFGGGGYVDLAITDNKVTRFEAALEFGASASIGIGIAKAEVHVLGGIRYELAAGGGTQLSGYLRFGGAVDILGLISVSLEVVITLTYTNTVESPNALIGRATLVVTIDLTFYSDSVTVDTGEYTISGDPASDHSRLLSPTDGAETGLAAWQEYRRAFRKAGQP
ncbi:hypothetical protein [Streptomyces nymphaeiformis]|uniref:Uncharacterized protein n=1 Tax=Streptomyces nymphaeiformis TaxID=2663842 RepID=A0A7W7U8W7_9ACTN|nr:hypothetical protein [Streptomyces nymphaeiformis]MBB4987089.1 hypothetical protein [Streptomyces nymphaeiformis]